MQWLTYISGVLTAPIIIGLAAWFGKLWASRILEKDRAKYQGRIETLLADIRTRDTKELLVHRLQFEKEFEVYKELWAAALRLGKASSNFRMLQIGQPASEEEIKYELETSHKDLSDTVYNNRPFYAPDVYETAKAMLDKICKIVSERSILKQLEQRNMSETQVEKACQIDKEIERNLDEINNLLGELCCVIRKRVWSTAISGWDRLDDTSV